MANIDYNKSVYCIVTGASRGIGRTIAVETARRAKNNIVLVLIARTEKSLNETKDLINEVNKNAKIHIITLDLSKPDVQDYENVLKSTLVDIKDLFSAVIFHNAGHIGCIEKVVNLPDVKVWNDYFTLNLFSATALNTVFVNQVKELTKNMTVVNITSLIGRQPFSYFGMYGSGKAARDLYFKVLAEEEKDIRVLSWSPGLVETDMSNEVITEMNRIKGSDNNAFQNPLSPAQTVNKMLMVLEENKFKSGDVVDYYDE